jgi:hypothetical protein
MESIWPKIKAKWGWQESKNNKGEIKNGYRNKNK